MESGNKSPSSFRLPRCNFAGMGKKVFLFSAVGQRILNVLTAKLEKRRLLGEDREFWGLLLFFRNLPTQ